jgi:hypothetical protein
MGKPQGTYIYKITQGLFEDYSVICLLLSCGFTKCMNIDYTTFNVKD